VLPVRKMDTLGHGEALLREHRLQQQRLLLDEAYVPPEIVRDAEMLEQSLSALRGKHLACPPLHVPFPVTMGSPVLSVVVPGATVSLKAEQLEVELTAALAASNQLREDNGLLNNRILQVRPSMSRAR
jgi:hypothetical protein